MAVIVIVAAAWVLRRTVFGRQILATGGNEARPGCPACPIARVKLWSTASAACSRASPG